MRMSQCQQVTRGHNAIMVHKTMKLDVLFVYVCELQGEEAEVPRHADNFMVVN